MASLERDLIGADGLGKAVQSLICYIKVLLSQVSEDGGMYQWQEKKKFNKLIIGLFGFF